MDYYIYRIKIVRFCYLLFAFFILTVLKAQEISYNQEFKVTDCEEGVCRVTGLTGGGFVVVWDNLNESDLIAQVFDGKANRIGTEFKVNSTSEYGAGYPSICSLANGGFVICWEQHNIMGTDLSVQIFNPQGQKIGTEISLSETDVSIPSICGLANGGFVISWNSNESYPKVLTQIFDKTGNKIGPVIEVDSNPEFTLYWYYPDVCGLADNGFVIGWQTWTGVSTGIKAQIFDDSGKKVGPEFQVGSSSENGLFPSICKLINGGFVVSRETSTDIYGDNRIMTQLFDDSGNKIGSEFRANMPRQGIHTHNFDISSLTGGGFVICWKTWDEMFTGIAAQVFDQDGHKVGWDFQVNSRNNISAQSISGLEGGGFVIGWQYYRDGIYGKYYLAPINHAFIPFSLIEPAYDTSLDTTSVTFKWSRAINTRINLPWEIIYRLYLDETEEFDNSRTVGPLTDTTCIVDNLIPGKTYFWKVQASNIGGDSLWSSETFGFFIRPVTSIDGARDASPSAFELFQNYPNPFNSETTIGYRLGTDTEVDMGIYNYLGKKLTTLVAGRQAAGKYEVKWQAAESASGIYYCHLKAGKYHDTIKLLLIK